MSGGKVRIGVVAPGGRSTPEVAARVQALAASTYPRVEIVFHPQCFLAEGHFAGPDQARADAFVEVANDPSFDALWFARGGYGAGRLTELVLPRLTEAAKAKTYLGYSDAGSLLGALYGRGFRNIVHGSMPQDIVRAGGEAAVARSLAWLVDRAPSSLEGGLVPGQKTAAFNLVILGHLLGTPWMPDLSGHVLLIEEVSEYMYRIDRNLVQLTSNPDIRKVAGIRLGRCSDIPVNDPDFGRTEEEVARYWCERAGIPYLGRADIGHDVDNKVVPFGGI
ncbi:LD-carboxypeptidase [Caulobacter sp. 17J80-11]|uniref:LD-carboxypeptidase n=1 Tax=Caulobacter sp. 17J80-11 TaxID=2763502 RepID=UPI0016534CA6|nr:LD-carboxypeptidase [Caulobacter sp. 17J80-11]MBC6980851.1 LD-carboxypeptidase [Caulobacter sp. 17J80-11]